MMGHNSSLSLVTQLILSLGWRDVLVLRDDTVGLSPDMKNITFMDYDITFSTDEHLLTILNDTQAVTQQTLNLLLLCNNYRTVRVLKQMEEFDFLSISTFDMRHSSRILTAGSKKELDFITKCNTLVENIAVMDISDQREVSHASPLVWTLIFSEEGRVFVNIPLPSWPRVKLHTVFPNIQYGYNGRNLTVVMKKYLFPYGYHIVGNISVWSMYYRTLEYLSQHLNFSPIVVPPREDEWGRNNQGSWTGVVGMLQRKEADFAASALSVSRDRDTVIDCLLPPVVENRYYILYKMEEEEDALLVYLRPFSPAVFLFLSLSVLVYPLFLCTDRRIHEGGPRTEMESDMRTSSMFGLQSHDNNVLPKQLVMTYMSAFLDTVKAALRQGSQMAVSHVSGRILVSVWWIFTIIISSVYCGTILASLAVALDRQPFSNLEELVARNDYNIGHDPSSVLGLHLQSANTSDINNLNARIREIAIDNPEVLSTDINKHFENVEKGKYTILVGTHFTIYQTRTNCRWSGIDANLERGHLFLTVPKKSPYKKEFEKSMYHLQDYGILQRFQEEWVRSIPEDRCPVKEVARPISLRQIQSIFIVVGIGVCFSIVVLCGEMIWQKVSLL